MFHSQWRSSAEGQHRVVRAGVAIHGDGIERALNRSAHHPTPNCCIHAGIAAEEAEHRGHVRMNHSGALGHPANPHRPPPQLSLNSRLFLHKICGENRLRCSGPTAIRQRCNQRPQAGQQRWHGYRHTNHTGGADQHGVVIKAQLVCNGLRRSLTIQQATVASTGVGLARVDQHGSSPTVLAGEPISTEIHTSGPHHRRGERARTHRFVWGEDQGQIWATRGLKARHNPCRLKTVRRRDPTIDGRPNRSHRFGRVGKRDFTHLPPPP